MARLKTRLVAQGANIPFTLEADASCIKRGALVLPDFIANAGGVICASVEYHGGTQSTGARRSIEEKIRANTDEVVANAHEDRLAAAPGRSRHWRRREMKKAMTYQKWLKSFR